MIALYFSFQVIFLTNLPDIIYRPITNRLFWIGREDEEIDFSSPKNVTMTDVQTGAFRLSTELA